MVQAIITIVLCVIALSFVLWVMYNIEPEDEGPDESVPRGIDSEDSDDNSDH